MRGAENRTAIQIAAGSVLAAVVVLALKAYAAWWTGSIALYSDALESVVNVVTAAAALIAVRLAARPADAALPYGYHKAEYFSAVVTGVIIVVAAILIFREAWLGFIAPRPFRFDSIGLGVSLLATAVNAGWAVLLLRMGGRVRSPALQADGRHLVTDVISTLGVLAGVSLAALTGYGQLDAALAALVGLAVLWSGWNVVRQSVGGLMDAAVAPPQLAQMREIISGNAQGAIEAHDLRTRRAGRMTFIDFHLVVPGSMSVEDAHAICDRIEARLREVIKDSLITIHVEPENKAKHSGIVVV